MASLGGDFQSDGGLLNQLGSSSSNSSNARLGGGLEDEPLGFDEWLSSMKVDEEDDEVGRRYRARIEGQCGAQRKLRPVWPENLKKKGEIRVEVSGEFLVVGWKTFEFKLTSESSQALALPGTQVVNLAACGSADGGIY